MALACYRNNRYAWKCSIFWIFIAMTVGCLALMCVSSVMAANDAFLTGDVAQELNELVNSDAFDRIEHLEALEKELENLNGDLDDAKYALNQNISRQYAVEEYSGRGHSAIARLKELESDLRLEVTKQQLEVDEKQVDINNYKAELQSLGIDRAELKATELRLETENEQLHKSSYVAKCLTAGLGGAGGFLMSLILTLWYNGYSRVTYTGGRNMYDFHNNMSRSEQNWVTRPVENYFLANMKYEKLTWWKNGKYRKYADRDIADSKKQDKWTTQLRKTKAEYEMKMKAKKSKNHKARAVKQESQERVHHSEEDVWKMSENYAVKTQLTEHQLTHNEHGDLNNMWNGAAKIKYSTARRRLPALEKISNKISN